MSKRASDTTLVRDVKSTHSDQVLYVMDTWPLRRTIDYLAQHNIGLALVVDADERLAGVVSERDVVRAIYEHGRDAMDMRTASFMSPDVYTCDGDDTVMSVALEMVSRGFRHMPVVDDGYLAGMISATDLIRCFTAGSPGGATSPDRD